MTLGADPDVSLTHTPGQPYPFLSPAQAPDELGRLAGFRVLRLLGQGGMGLVFEAAEDVLGRRVALKVLRPEAAADPQGRKRFLREARAVAALEHDHVVAIHQVVEANGTPFFVMPLLRGETLAARLDREGPPPLPEALRIGREIADGLAAAHQAGLIHRDVKPANVWLEAPNGRVKLLDFGLVRLESRATKLTRLGATPGTPGFMAPEQAAGQADHRSDLFGLGCVLYLMVSGQTPFGDDPLQAVRAGLVPTQAQALATLNRVAPPALSALVTELLARQPQGRPLSAGAVVERLRSLEGLTANTQSKPAAAGTPRISSLQGASSRRRRLASWMAVLAVVGIIVLLAAVLSRRPDNHTARTTPGPQDHAETPGDRNGQIGKEEPHEPANSKAPAGAVRSIAGEWLEETEARKGLRVVIRQTGEAFTAECDYREEHAGQIHWQMTGKIFVDGRLEGRLVHTKAPPAWLHQVRKGKLSEQGDTITGRAEFDGGGGHDFVWKRIAGPADGTEPQPQPKQQTDRTPTEENEKPKVASVEGTTWSWMEGGSVHKVTFKMGGVLAYKSRATSDEHGTWKQVDNKIYFETNNKAAEYNGTIEGNIMKGAASDIRGRKWKFQLNRE